MRATHHQILKKNHTSKSQGVVIFVIHHMRASEKNMSKTAASLGWKEIVRLRFIPHSIYQKNERVKKKDPRAFARGPCCPSSLNDFVDQTEIKRLLGRHFAILLASGDHGSTRFFCSTLQYTVKLILFGDHLVFDFFQPLFIHELVHFDLFLVDMMDENL